jgi:mannose-6-phosphate isomerase-like protein (cupin superfamily)
MSGLVRDCAEVPERRVGNDATAVREVLDSNHGCELFTLRLLRTVRGHGIARDSGAAEELLFTVAGRGLLVVGDGEYELEPESGALVAPGSSYELVNDASADLLIVAVSLNEPLAHGENSAPVTLSRLRDEATQTATANRELRVVFDPDNGCASATQYVDCIPIGARPAHYHHYDEVIYVLDGAGEMHMNGERTPIHEGFAIHLPVGEVHTLENSGPDVMRVLGVFRPAGSPAAAFHPDGAPAYTWSR